LKSVGFILSSAVQVASVMSSAQSASVSFRDHCFYLLRQRLLVEIIF